MNQARPIYVVNSRLPDVVTGLFTRIAPKILPIGKELASKAIRVGDKSAATTAVVRAFNAVKEKIASLMRKTASAKSPNDVPFKLPFTTEMPQLVANEINKMAKEKLETITGSGLRLSI